MLGQGISIKFRNIGPEGPAAVAQDFFMPIIKANGWLAGRRREIECYQRHLRTGGREAVNKQPDCQGNQHKQIKIYPARTQGLGKKHACHPYHIRVC